MKKFSQKEIEDYHKKIGITVEDRKTRRLAEGWTLEEIESEIQTAIMMSKIFDLENEKRPQ